MAKLTKDELLSMVEYIAERLKEAGDEGGLSASSCSEIADGFRKALDRK
jgi:hypothetical protein